MADGRGQDTPDLFTGDPKASIDGSAPRLALLEGRPEWGMATWLPEGDYLISLAGVRSFLRMPENMSGEGTLIEVKFHDAETRFGAPTALPDERAVLLNAMTYSTEGWRVDVALMDLNSGEARILIAGGGNARYAPTGHLLFSRGETLLAAPFNLQCLEPVGGPVPLINGLRANASWDVGNYQIANDGTLVYPPGGLVASRRKIAVAGPDGVDGRPVPPDRRPGPRGKGGCRDRTGVAR